MLRKDYQLLVDTSIKEKKSIERCIQFQNRDENNRNICAFSGGKDSLVAYMMCVLSGINFIPVYSLTGVDPPELVNFIRHTFNKWAKSNNYPEIVIAKYKKFNKRRLNGRMEGREITMFTLIGNRTIPPTRLARYCCDELKERAGNKGDTVITGVRWEESPGRAEQKMVNFYKGKKMIRVIVDWTETEVWSYLIRNGIPYCSLYDNGYNRIGCIGCPLSKNQIKELEDYPKYKENYIRAFNKMIEYRHTIYNEAIIEEELEYLKNNDNEAYKNYIKNYKKWETGEDVYLWWIGVNKTKKPKYTILENQCSMF